MKESSGMVAVKSSSRYVEVKRWLWSYDEMVVAAKVNLHKEKKTEMGKKREMVAYLKETQLWKPSGCCGVVGGAVVHKDGGFPFEYGCGGRVVDVEWWAVEWCTKMVPGGEEMIPAHYLIMVASPLLIGNPIIEKEWRIRSGLTIKHASHEIDSNLELVQPAAKAEQHQLRW